MLHNFEDRHALDGLAASDGRAGADHLAIAERQAIVLVLSAPGKDASVAALLAADEELSVRFSAPGEWLVVSSVQTADILQQALSALLGEAGWCIDQSHGRVLFRLSGPNARAILARGVGIDLHPTVFPVGSATNVLCGHISINLALRAPDCFELIVMRSFAESLLHDLRAMGRAFDLSVGFAT